MNKYFSIILTILCTQHSWSQIQSKSDNWILSDSESYCVLYDSSDAMHTIVFDSISYFEVFVSKSYSNEAYISWGKTKFTNDSILFLAKQSVDKDNDVNFSRLNLLATLRSRRPYVMVRPMVKGIRSYNMFCNIKPELPQVVGLDFEKFNNSLGNKLSFVRNGIFTVESEGFSHVNDNDEFYSGGIVSEVFPTDCQLMISVFCGLFSFHFQVKGDENIQTNMYLTKEQLDSLIKGSLSTIYVETHTLNEQVWVPGAGG